MLDVEVERRLGAFTVAASFTSSGTVTVLFGRSGSGKTSLINMIGGLLRPERGRIAVAGRVLFDHKRGIDLPPRKRRIGCVFQEGRLFPHLTVRQNLLYGWWFTAACERYAKPEMVIDLLGIGPLLQRRPADLSGGEKQRVAIGRALLASPRLLLMDEPLVSLDAARKSEILPYIERLRDELRLPIVYVSHSLDEVTRLADTLVLIAGGRVAAIGPVHEVMSRFDLGPLIGRYEAGAVLDARVLGHDARFELTDLGFAGGVLRVPRIDLPVGAATRLRIRARDVVIATQPPQGLSMLNALRGRVREMTREEGPFAELLLDVGGVALCARVTRQAVHLLDLAPGREVYALVKSVALDRHSLGFAGGPPPALPGPERRS